MKAIHTVLATLLVVAAALLGASAEARFLANDPVPFDPNNPAQFNRYAYSHNDPINMIDPDGRKPEWSYSSLRMGGVMSHDDAIGVQRATLPASRNAFLGMVAGATSVMPGPEDGLLVAGGARLGATQLARVNAHRGFSQATKYVARKFGDGVRSRRSGTRTQQFDGTGGAQGADKLFGQLTKGTSRALDSGGRMGRLGDGSRVQISSRVKDGVRETSVRIQRERTGSRLKDNTKIRFREKIK